MYTDRRHAYPRAPGLPACTSGGARFSVDDAQTVVAKGPLIVIQTHARTIPPVVGIAPSVGTLANFEPKLSPAGSP